MKKLEYNLHKIATNNKLILEVMPEINEYNEEQINKLYSLINDTQKMMLETTIDYLIFKEEYKQLLKISYKPYIGDVVKAVRKNLLKLKKELNIKFNNNLINYIDF